MADREQAIAEIQSAKLELISARDLLTPITDFMDLGLIDPVGAYNYIRLAIDECTFAIEGLQQAPGEPLLYFEPTSYTFEYPSSAAGLTITNNGSGTLSGTVTVQAAGGGPAPSWLTVQPQTFSLSQGASSAHSVNMEWQQFPTGQTLQAEVAITSNGGTGVMAITAHRAEEPPPGDPVLAVQPLELVIPYPAQSEPFEIFNSGDQTKMISWTVTESESYSWMSQQPTSGTVTSERDSVDVIPDWNTWPTNQGIVTREGDLVVAGTYQGNPTQGSPKTVHIVTSKNTGVPSGMPPNCIESSSHPGYFFCCDDPNSNNADCGVDAWYRWCVRGGSTRHPTAPGGWKGMRSYAGATIRCDRYVTPTQDGSLTCQLRFPPSWINNPYNSGGGQHFFQWGMIGGSEDRSPCHIPRLENAIRVDFHGAWDSSLGGWTFGNGLRIYIYQQRNYTENRVTAVSTSSTVINGVWDPDTWYDVVFSANYDPSSGRVTGRVQYKTGVTRDFSSTVWTGLTAHPLGWLANWGNVDGHSNPDTGEYVEIRNEAYRVGGQLVPI